MVGKFVTKREQTLLVDLHGTTDAAFSVDMDQRIVSWNHGVESLLGVQAEDVVGRRCSEVMTMCHPGEGRFCATPCAAVANTRRGRVTPLFRVSMTNGRDDASTKWLSISTLIGHTLTGQPQVLHFVRDVSAHHLLDDRVAELSRAHAPNPGPEPRGSHHAHHAEQARSTPRPQLTQRELEVLQFVASGLSNAQIAERLSISPFTVRNHITNVAEKLGVKTRLQAVVAASLQEII